MPSFDGAKKRYMAGRLGDAFLLELEFRRRAMMEIYASIDPQGIVRKKFQIKFPEEESMINEMVYPPAENERMSPEKQPFQKENSLPTIIFKGACLVFGGCKFCQTTCMHHRKRKTH